MKGRNNLSGTYAIAEKKSSNSLDGFGIVDSV